MASVARQFQLSGNATELYARYSGRIMDPWVRGLENFGGFSLGDAEEVHGLTTGAGFRNVHVRPTVKTSSLPPPEEMVAGFLGHHPAAEAVGALAEADRVALLDDIIEALAPYVREEGLVLPGKVHLATGTA